MIHLALGGVYLYTPLNIPLGSLGRCRRPTEVYDVIDQMHALILAHIQPSTCSSLLAVNHANTKKNRGLHATGVAAAICA